MDYTAGRGTSCLYRKVAGCLDINQRIPITLEETQHTVARILDDE